MTFRRQKISSDGQYSPCKIAVMSKKKKIIIVGGGFAGLNAAKSFINDPRFEVTLIDQRNHHLFQPLLYQVATAGLGVADIAVPIRAQFSEANNVVVQLAQIDQVDLSTQSLQTKTGEAFSYDYLILACGVRHSYFDHPEWEEVAPGLKTLEQATEIRRRILNAFERAERETDHAQQRALLTFVVVGGGPTGVELAGAIADISRTVLVRDFKRIDPSSAQVILVEAGPRILPSFSENLSAAAVKALHEIGVTVRLAAKVSAITAEGVTVGEEFLPTHTVLWAAGVKANELHFVQPVPRDKAGRCLVARDLSVPGFSNCFVIGDMAHVEQVPGVAPAAIQMGKHVAQVIRATEDHQARRDFHYFDKGSMATIGKFRAVMQFKQIESVGVFAWLSWVVIHILYLVGFKNKLSVFSQWVWSYLLSKRGSRLILSKEWRQGL